nr:T9SS type A sorting domain-containing protein [Bacteroidota bacterium]
EYTFTDRNVADPVLYYRLRQTDYDGTYAYSQIIAVRITQAYTHELKLYPNPAADQVMLTFDSHGEEQLTIAVTDLSGRTVWQEMIAADKVTTHLLNLETLPAGSYIVSVTSPNSTEQKLLIRQ